MINWKKVAIGTRLLLSSQAITRSTDNKVQKFFTEYAGKYVTFWATGSGKTVKVQELKDYQLPREAFSVALHPESQVRVWNADTDLNGFVVNVMIRKPSGKWEVFSQNHNSSVILPEECLVPLSLRVGDQIQMVDEVEVFGNVCATWPNGNFHLMTLQGTTSPFSKKDLHRVILVERNGKRTLPSQNIQSKPKETLPKEKAVVPDKQVTADESHQVVSPKNTVPENLDLWLETIRNDVQEGKKFFFVVDGNIYDLVPYGDQFINVDDALALVFDHYDYVLKYNIVSGVQIVKGDSRILATDLELHVDGKTKEAMAALQMGRTMKSDPSSLFPRLHKLLRRSDRKTLLIFDYAETLLDGKNDFCSLSLKQWARDDIIKQTDNTIVVMSRFSADLDQTLLDPMLGVKLLRVPKPDTMKSEKYIKLLSRGMFNDNLRHQIALQTNGLGYLQIREAIDKIQDSNLALSMIKKLRLQYLEQEYKDLFEFLKTGDGLDAVGGMETEKRELDFITQNIKHGRYHKVPKGIMFIGPPGTGKTILVTSWAVDLESFIVAVPLDPRGKYVGDTEKTVRKQRVALEEMGTVIVFRDEIDQDGSRGESGDSGTSKRVFRAWLEIMNNPAYRGRIIVVMATNRPDLLDMALVRSGRTDLRFAVIEPNENARRKIFEAIVQSRKRKKEIRCHVKDFSDLAKRTKGLTGSDIDTIITNTVNFVDRDGRKIVQLRDFIYAVEDFRKATVSRDQIDKSTLMAIDCVSSNSLMPEGWEDAVRQVHERLSDIRDPELHDLAERMIKKVK